MTRIRAVVHFVVDLLITYVVWEILRASDRRVSSNGERL
jgi:hypothetical protein